MLNSIPDNNGVNDGAASPINSAAFDIQMFESEEEGYSISVSECIITSLLAADIPETVNNPGRKRSYSGDEDGSSVNPTKSHDSNHPSAQVWRRERRLMGKNLVYFTTSKKRHKRIKENTMHVLPRN